MEHVEFKKWHAMSPVYVCTLKANVVDSGGGGGSWGSGHSPPHPFLVPPPPNYKNRGEKRCARMHRGLVVNQDPPPPPLGDPGTS